MNGAGIISCEAEIVEFISNRDRLKRMIMTADAEMLNRIVEAIAEVCAVDKISGIPQ